MGIENLTWGNKMLFGVCSGVCGSRETAVGRSSRRAHTSSSHIQLRQSSSLELSRVEHSIVSKCCGCHPVLVTDISSTTIAKNMPTPWREEPTLLICIPHVSSEPLSLLRGIALNARFNKLLQALQQLDSKAPCGCAGRPEKPGQHYCAVPG
eukprot:4791135-Amphidinium_carterae.1